MPSPPQAAPLALGGPQPVQPTLVRAIINPKRGMVEPSQSYTPQPPRSCNSAGPGGRWCGNLDVRVAVLLVTLAGALILLLLYKLLQLRHRLRLAQARHALEYHSFYHASTYTLKHPTSYLDPTVKNGTLPEGAPSVTMASTPSKPCDIITLDPSPAPPPPVLPPPPRHPPPPLPPTLPDPPVLALPLPLPTIHTTPPSPHLSWGACSDADVYSRIGAFRPSRLSSLSSQSTVILFEHSSL